MTPLLLRFLPHIALAVAAFLAGWYGGLRWEGLNTLRAEKALIVAERDRAARDLQAERERAAADIAARDAALAEQQRTAAAAARIAASASREALTARAIVAEKERELDAFREELDLERASRAGCDCTLSDQQRQRLRTRFPVGVGPASGGHPAAVGRGAVPLPRPGNRSEP